MHVRSFVVAVSIVTGASSPPSAPQCPLQVPADASRPMDENVDWLIGDFTLVQVATQPAGEPTITGRLHLGKPDTTIALPPRRRWPDLIGWFESQDSRPEWRAITSSHDPLNPGVTVADFGMWIGQHYMLDGASDNFQITAISPRGFSGWWKSDQGIALTLDTLTGRIIPDPAGYFCATRFN